MTIVAPGPEDGTLVAELGRGGTGRGELSDPGATLPLPATGEGRLSVLRSRGSRRGAAHRWLALVRRLARRRELTALRVTARLLLAITLGVALVAARHLRLDLARRLIARLHLRRRLFA